jgi:glycosyltransferase involved in cell wall biosynthesis
VYVDELVERWIVALVRATRDLEIVSIGASVRGSLALERATRAWALMCDRDYATPADVERVRARFGLHSAYVLWSGTVEPRKNLRRLVDAFGRLDADVDLVLAGPRGWSEDLGELTGAARRVRVLGFVPTADLPGLYAGARAFCFPSLLEGFGFPVLEAMTQGTPVVTARGTSTEEIAGDAALLVDPRDPDSIAGGLARVLDDAGLAGDLSERGLARAACFTWYRCAELVRAAYREVAA